MKVYLVNPPYKAGFVRCGRWQGVVARGGTLDYPKWLAYTAGMLEQNGHSVTLRDAVASRFSHSDVLEEVRGIRPDLVVAESNFSSLRNDIGVLGSIKSTLGGDPMTVLTGPPTAVYPEKILSGDSVDGIARFEYDFVVRDAAERLENGQSLSGVGGLWYREGGTIVRNTEREYSTSEELDTLPFVSKVYRDHLNIPDYYLSQSLYPEVQIFSGRGCPFKCSFCSWPENLMGRKYRSRSAENIVDEFEYVCQKLPEVKEIFIEDDTFTIDKKLVSAVCAGIKDRKLDITWSCNARATLDYPVMQEMKSAGCRLVIVGYESGSDEILKTIRKGVDTKQLRAFTRDAKRANLMTHGDFIFGLPGETKETAEQTLAFIKELRPNVLQVAVATPIPGTQFYDWAKENGHLLVDDLEESIDANGYQKCIISYPDFTKDDIDQYVSRALREYYLSPSFVPVALSNVLRKNGFSELAIMLRSARDFLRYMQADSGGTRKSATAVPEGGQQ
jgi:anaerobic magnesium-protoporphyrin IX monomethyl ester cyclase